MKLPPDAFEYYVGLGPSRSYREVAEHFGVSKRAVTHRATSEKWQDRLHGIERAALSVAEERLKESLSEMYSRHLKLLSVIQGKALETLQALPLTSSWDAVKALDLAMRHESRIRGMAKPPTSNQDS
jgi:hypothetical protein